MPEFTELQQNAKQLLKKMTGIFTKSQSCFTFFKALAPNNSILVDACTIGMLASSLDEENDNALIEYLQGEKKDSLLTLREFEEFKTQVLIGCYILKWQYYNSLVMSYINKSLIELFQQDLKISSFSEMEEKYTDSCLKVFSQYCTFVYNNRANRPYADLNKQLGESIQVDIHAVRFPSKSNSASAYGLYTGILHALGI